MVEQPVHLSGQHRILLQPAAVRQMPQLGVGHGAPKEVGQPGRQLVTGECVPSLCGRGGLHPEQEFGGDQDCLQRDANAFLKGIPTLRGAIEEGKEWLDFRTLHRPAVCAPQEPLQDQARLPPGRNDRRPRLTPKEAVVGCALGI